MKVGDRVYVPIELNDWWTGEGEVVDLYQGCEGDRKSVGLKMLTGRAAGQQGAFPIAKLMVLKGEEVTAPEPAAAPEQVIRYQLVQPPAKYQTQLDEVLQLMPNVRLVASAIDKAVTGGQQSKDELLIAMAKLLVAFGIERS